MNPRKRQAPDTLPTRRHKQPRLTLKGYSGGKPSPSEKEGLLSRWNRFRMDFVALSADTLTVIFSKITLREPSNPRETESLNASSSLSSSTPQQISSPTISSLLNGSPDSRNSRPSRTVSPPCIATTPRGQLSVQPITPTPNGIISIDLKGRLRDLPESPSETKFPRPTQQTQLDDRKFTPEHIQISNQVTPTGNVNQMPYPSTPNRVPLRSEQENRGPEYFLSGSVTRDTPDELNKMVQYRHRPEDVDLLSTSRTTSDSLSKDSSFPPAGSSLTSWSSKDDPSDRRKSLHLGSSSLGSPHRFRFSTTSSNSHPPPDSHIPSSRKSSIALRRRSSGQYNRNRPHIHDKVHKAKVQRERIELREDLKKEYKSKRRTGNYISSWTDFLGYKNYEKLLQDIDLDIVSHPPRSFVLPTDDLYSADIWGKVLLQGDSKLKSAAHSAWHSIEQPQNPVQRALDNANATLNSPGPAKPYIPNLEQLQVSHRTRDDEIERRIRPVISFPSCLPPADDAKVSALLFRNGVISKLAREQVSDQDIARLLPGQWLNDEVINFYGAMILARSEGSKENPGPQRNGKTTKKATFLDVHYFSSFFWSKLTTEGYEKGRLAKWTKKIDIFNKDIILIPVNHQNSHWTAAAINFKDKRVESYDSMGIAKEKVFTHLRSYINAEHMNKRKKPFDFSDWKNWAPDTTPQQENGFDCGVFTCQFLETLSRGEESFRFSQKIMPYIRRRMIWEIGNAALRDDHY